MLVKQKLDHLFYPVHNPQAALHPVATMRLWGTPEPRLARVREPIQGGRCQRQRRLRLNGASDGARRRCETACLPWIARPPWMFWLHSFTGYVVADVGMFPGVEGKQAGSLRPSAWGAGKRRRVRAPAACCWLHVPRYPCGRRQADCAHAHQSQRAITLSCCSNNAPQTQADALLQDTLDRLRAARSNSAQFEHALAVKAVRVKPNQRDPSALGGRAFTQVRVDD